MEKSDANWQDLRPRERMEYLLKTGHLSDCSFVVYDGDDNKILIKCHKFLLMSVSPVFERMFDGDFTEAKTPDNIVLDDVSGPDFEKFIKYLYWHDIQQLESYDLNTLQNLIYLSKKFMVSSFTSDCITVIKRRLQSGLGADVTVDLFEYSHQIEDEELIKSIKLLFKSQPKMYVKTAAVYDLSSGVFLKFMEEFCSILQENVRFNVIDRYCKIHGLVVSPESKVTESHENNEDKDYLNLTKRGRALTEAVKTGKHNEDELEEEKEKEDSACKKDENENDVNKEKDKVASADQMAKEQNDQEVEKNMREAKKRAEYVRKLLNTIKFTSMSAYDFCSGPGTSNLLPIEEKYAWLSSICIGQPKQSMFCTRALYSESSDEDS